jgi:hypothetical protein
MAPQRAAMWLLLGCCCLAASSLDAGAAPVTGGGARHVRWYMASGAEADIALNEAFLSEPRRRRAITGAYACCNFWMINASTGALIGDSAGNYSDRFGPFLSRDMTVHAHGMLNEAALKSGAAMNAIPALAEFVKNNGIHGVLADYEPLDATMEHAQLFAKWLEAASAAVHAIPVKPGEPRREVGVDIADWSIIGPGFWPLYNASSVDFMATMTPTYGETARDWPYLASLVQGIAPEHRIDVGVASALQTSGPAGGRCAKAPFNSTFSNWSICNTTVSVGGNPYTSKDPNCPWNACVLDLYLVLLVIVLYLVLVIVLLVLVLYLVLVLVLDLVLLVIVLYLVLVLDMDLADLASDPTTQTSESALSKSIRFL